VLRSQPDPPAVVVLTTFDTDELVLRALRAGAAGFLLKDTPPAEIVRAIELVHAGDGMLSPAVTRQLIALVAGEGGAPARRDGARELLGSISPRERVGARALGRGLPNADIAAELHMSVATVKAHVSRLLVKLRRREPRPDRPARAGRDGRLAIATRAMGRTASPGGCRSACSCTAC
jgi:DNA-binding NarL/FixJ family response regulator